MSSTRADKEEYAWWKTHDEAERLEHAIRADRGAKVWVRPPAAA